MICNWGHHPADLVQWANDTERTGPVEVEGRGDLPPAQGLYNTIGEFQARYRYANGVELHYIGRKDYQEGESYMLFEGSEGWVRAWRAPNRIEPEPKSILSADVKFEDFPFLLRNEKTDFIECVRDAGRRRSGPPFEHRGAVGLHRLSVGPQAEVGPREGRMPRRRRGQHAGARSAGAAAVDDSLVDNPRQPSKIDP